MVTYLKQGKSDADVAEADAKVRGIVEDILSDIEKRGDAAVRELSEKFDGFTREEFRLSEDEIKAAVSKVPQTDIEDIEFAQKQVPTSLRNKRNACRTWKSKPCRACSGPSQYSGKFGRLLRAGREVSDGCLRPYDVLTASVAGVRRIVASAPPQDGEPHPAIVAAMHMGGRTRFWCSAVSRRSVRWRSGPSLSPASTCWLAPAICLSPTKRLVRPGRDRPIRRPDGDDHCGRKRRCGNLCCGFAGPGGTRADISRVSDYKFPQAGGRDHGRGRTPTRDPADRRYRERCVAGLRHRDCLRQRRRNGGSGR